MQPSHEASQTNPTAEPCAVHHPSAIEETTCSCEGLRGSEQGFSSLSPIILREPVDGRGPNTHHGIQILSKEHSVAPSFTLIRWK